MRKRAVLFLSLFLVAAVLGAAYDVACAQDFKGRLVTVKENQRLSDVVEGGLRAALIVQLVNGIRNAYDLKPGMKLIIPDADFINKVKDLPVNEIMEKAREYKSKVPPAVAQEALASLAENDKKKTDAAEQAALEAQQKALEKMGMKSVGGLKGVEPVEYKKDYPFRRNDSPYKFEN